MVCMYEIIISREHNVLTLIRRRKGDTRSRPRSRDEKYSCPSSSAIEVMLITSCTASQDITLYPFHCCHYFQTFQREIRGFGL